jgi:hypothetical protein
LSGTAKLSLVLGSPDFLMPHHVLAQLLLVQLEQDVPEGLQVVDPLDDAGRLIQWNDSLGNVAAD